MPSNRLLDRLRADFDTTTTQYEDVLNRCADEDRDPSPMELRSLDEMRSILDPLADRIVELQETLNRRNAVLTALGSATPDSPPTADTVLPVAGPGSNNGMTYRPPNPEAPGRGGSRRCCSGSPSCGR